MATNASRGRVSATILLVLLYLAQPAFAFGARCNELASCCCDVPVVETSCCASELGGDDEPVEPERVAPDCDCEALPAPVPTSRPVLETPRASAEDSPLSWIRAQAERSARTATDAPWSVPEDRLERVSVPRCAASTPRPASVALWELIDGSLSRFLADLSIARL